MRERAKGDLERTVRAYARLLTPAVGGIFICLSALSFLGAWHWAFELLSHFRVQFLLTAAFGMLIFFVLRWRRLGAVLAALSLAHLTPILAHMDRTPDGAMRPGSDGIAEISAFYLNMHHRSADHEAFLSHIGRIDPDIVVLTEVDPARRKALFSALGMRYPERLATQGNGPFDMAVFSKHPMHAKEARLDHGSHWPMVRAAICPEGYARCAELIAVHAPRPGRRWTARRNDVFAQIAALAKEGEGPLVVMGDFNSTPWSPAFQGMLARGALHDGGAVYAALAPTWISRFAPFGLDIDHVLTGGGMSERGREIGPAFGSDHFSVHTRLVADLGGLAPISASP